MSKVWYPEHLPQVRVSEAEGDVGDVEALGLGLVRPSLLVAPTSCPSSRCCGHAQGLRVRGHGCQSILLGAGKRVTWEKRVGSKWRGGEGRTGTEEGGTTTKRWETKDGRMKECECGGGEKSGRERQNRREEENQGKKINE